jgi:hypothetical protein
MVTGLENLVFFARLYGMSPIQLGLTIYDLMNVPIGTALFLGLATMVFDIAIDPSGVLPALAILLLLIPFVWGIGMVSAGVVITVRQGDGFLGIGALALNVSSGAYFPLDLRPDWLEALARINPIAIAFDGTREALLAGAVWAPLTSDMVSPRVCVVAGRGPRGRCADTEARDYMISTDMYVRRSEDVAYADIGTDGVLLSLDDGQYYSVNDLGRQIWSLLADGTVGELVRELRDHVTDPPAEIEQDVIEFLEGLRERRLVEVSAHAKGG